MVNIKAIKNDRRYFWTNHSKGKLIQYNLSPGVVKRTVNRPQRVEEGVAPDTTALMIRKDTKKSKREIWVMVQKHGTWNMEHGTKNIKTINSARIRIISAWIYPGISPKGKEIFVPDDVLEELNNLDNQ